MRERLDDVEPLALHFARDVDVDATFSPEAIQALRARAWPGNVRELSNAAVARHAGVHPNSIHRLLRHSGLK